MGRKKQPDNQLSIFDIELPQNVPEIVLDKVESLNTQNDTIPEEHPEAINFTPAKVPDEEFQNMPKIIGDIPSVKGILKLMDKGTYKVGRYEFLSDLFDMGAIAISNKFDRIQAPEREKTYLAIIKKYDKDTQQLFVETFTEIYNILSNMINSRIGFADYLGELYMQSETSSSKAGQFFTPYNISKMCAKLSLDENVIKEAIEQDKIITLHEPTCGSGGMVLAAADVLYNEYHFNISRNLFVECGDIDKRCVRMAYLQLSLAGIPAVIYHRDGLTLETWERWETPAYIMQWLRFRNCLKGTANDWQPKGE